MSALRNWLTRASESLEAELMRSSAFLICVGITMCAMQMAERVLA